MKKIIFIIMMIFITGCDIDKFKDEFLYKEFEREEVIFESPENHIKIVFSYNTEDEKIKYWELYKKSIREFENNIYDDYENQWNDVSEINKPIR